MMVGKLTLTWKGKEQSIEDCENYSFNGYGFKENIERSINFDTTENIIIEGDNLDVLKLLQSEYQKKIKMIYIDPPYNTGNKGVYKDKYWKARECKHSNWLNMMYPRLKLARELLRDDGVIFVSIDDNEQANLKLLMDEVFGEDMFIGNVIWEKTYSPQNMNKFISCNHDYIAIYRKSKSLEKFTGLPRTENQNRRYTNRDNDPRGDWKSGDFSCMGKNQNRRYTNIDNDPRGDWASDNFSCMGKNNIYPITNPIGKIIYPPEGRSWKFSKEKYEKLKQDNRIWFGKDGNAKPSFKLFLNEAQQHIVTQTIWRYENVGHTDGNTKQLKTIFNGKAVFDFPKGTKLITKMLQISTSSNDIILDFFAGSGTTGHAVMQLNLEEKKQAIENGEDPTLVGNRKYIMVQLPELIDEKTDAYKAGYKKISDITIERVKRAGNKISEENPDVNLDVGFKVCELIS